MKTLLCCLLGILTSCLPSKPGMPTQEPLHKSSRMEQLLEKSGMLPPLVTVDRSAEARRRYCQKYPRVCAAMQAAHTDSLFRATRP